MRSKVLAIAICFGAVTLVQAQSDPAKVYHNFPIIVSVQFHSFSLPFRNLGSNFRNVGIGLGTEVSLNGKDNWAQQFGVVWYANKNLGNGILIHTQSVWRPIIADQVYSEVKMGLGYLYSYRPSESYQQMNGEWVSVHKKGKMMFTLPVGLSLGYHNYSTSTQVSPFVSYQFLLVNGYNKSIPLVPETLLQVGSRVHVK